MGLQSLVARTPAQVQGTQGMIVGWGDFFGRTGGHSHVLQQSIVQTIKLTV